jgi:YesN/AraC family two-component response regulator
MLVEGEYGIPCALGVGRWGRSRSSISPSRRPRRAQALRPDRAPDAWSKAALEIIRTRYLNDISVAAISEELHAAPTTFQALQARDGEGCNEYITGVRIKARKSCSRQ